MNFQYNLNIANLFLSTAKTTASKPMAFLTNTATTQRLTLNKTTEGSELVLTNSELLQLAKDFPPADIWFEVDEE